MKRSLLIQVLTLFAMVGLEAQVTQINSNRSLRFNYPLSNSKAIYVSGIDQTLWVTDGTLAGTIQLSATIKFDEAFGGLTFLDGKYIFAGNTPATGREVYITDGTPGGTILVKDINPGSPGSGTSRMAIANGFMYFKAATTGEGEELWRTDGTPGGTTLVKDINPGPPGSLLDDETAFLNNVFYFTAETALEGRELWKSDGTTGGTSLVKDIVTGPGGSNYRGKYSLFATNTYLLLMARTPSSGVELWRSDGTNGGTVLLKDINTGNGGADSSNARSFFILNNIVLFAATDAPTGDEIWRTDGTPAGTSLLANINPAGSSTKIDLGFGFGFDIFSGFHTFNNRAYFNANDGTSAGEVWGTDGTAANTSLLKNIVPGVPPASISSILVTSALNLPGKFIFPVADQTGRSELWESNGTPAGTVLFKAFSPFTAGSFPFILTPFSLTLGFTGQPLFQGDKFFFSAGTAAEGNELWVSDGVDGTVAHTRITRDINTGTPAGYSFSTYLYTSAALFFTANNGINGAELWKSDGTLGGTTMVADIGTGSTGSDPTVNIFIVNGKVLFEANNRDDPRFTDLYAVDGTFSPLPVSLADFTVSPKDADAILNWRTLQEINSKNFTVERSFDGRDFKPIGTVEAAGTTNAVHTYSLIDAGIMNSRNNIVYYRLLSTDIDGKSSLSPVITLKLKNAGNWKLSLLTNPVGDRLKLLLSGISQQVQVSIVDMSGKRLYINKLAAVNGQLSLPAGNLPRGRYILVAETGNDIKTIQFVK